MPILAGVIGDGYSTSETQRMIDWQSGTNAFAFGGLLGRLTTAGMRVSAEHATTLSSYWAVNKVIAEDLAKLPIKIHKRTGERSREDVPQHEANKLLNRQPNPWMLAISFRESMQMWAQTWGGAVAEIERNAMGRVVALHPIHPTRLRIEVLDSGEPEYHVLNNAGTYTVLRPEDVFHLRGFSKDGIEGYSILQIAAESIGAGLAQQRFGAAFFGNGAHAGTIFERDIEKGRRAFNKDALDTFRRSWKEAHEGALKAGGFAILPPGLRHKTATVPPDQAQFLESQKFTVEEMCRWLRVQPFKVQHMDRATWSNFEQANTSHADDTLVPPAMRWTQEIDSKLLTEAEQDDHYAKFNMRALKMGDMAARGEWYVKMMQNGVYSVNDVLALEDEPGIGPEGDVRRVAVNTTPASGEAEDETAEDDPPEPEQEDEAAANAMRQTAETMRPVFTKAIARTLARFNKAAGNKRAKLDAEAFNDWLSAFCAQERAVLCDDLDPAAEALCRLCGVQVDHRQALGMFANVHYAELYDHALAWCVPSDIAPQAARKAIGMILAMAAEEATA